MDNLSDIRIKESALTERIKAAGKLAVAFSGGVDSTYLLYKAHQVLGDDCIAVTVRSQVLAEDDFNRTVEFCKEIGAKQEIIDFDVFSVDKFAENPPDRCYYCKNYDFEGIKRVASEHGITAVADGSNVDDTGDYRPGMRAMKELGIISLLKESGLTKKDIRALSKEAGLATWDMPAAACLASRFVYGERITAEGLKRVELSEKFIRDLKANGDTWILYTMREGKLLDEALAFLIELGIPPDAANDNLPELCEAFHNNPRKVFANVYIDDHNAGGLRFDTAHRAQGGTK